MTEVKLEDFEQHRPNLLLIAGNLTKVKRDGLWFYQRMLAEDIVQDTYLRFHKIIVGKKVIFEDESHVEQILIKNVWRLCMTSKANNKGVVYKCKEESSDLIKLNRTLRLTRSPNVLSELAVKHIFSQIRKLKSKKDSIALIQSIKGYDNSEIASNFNITTKAATACLYRARKELKLRLKLTNKEYVGE